MYLNMTVLKRSHPYVFVCVLLLLFLTMDQQVTQCNKTLYFYFILFDEKKSKYPFQDAIQIVKGIINVGKIPKMDTVSK